MQHSRVTSGFLLPTIVIMLGASTMIMLALFQYVATTTNLTSAVIYRQVALTAARGALEYGKEQFDSNLAFDGTKDGAGNPIELTMFTNATYRVTYQVAVQETSSDGRVKRVQGVGRVYLPASASDPRYIRTINGEIIRSQIVQKDPSDYNPLAWYDASCNASTSTEPDCAANTVLTTAASSATANPTSLREERQNGNYCNGSPQTTAPSNNQLDITRQGECGSGNQTDIGFMFNFGGNLPKGATVTSATLRLTSNAADSSSLVVRVKGLSAANYPNFTTAAGAQLNGVTRTSAYVDWTMPTWNTSGVSANSPNLAGILQEIIERPDWATGNNIGLSIEHQNGAGRRRAQTTQITLSITYTGAQVPANEGELVKTWRDRSGNSFDLTANNANRPTKSTISGNGSNGVMNSKPMVSFATNSSWMSSIIPASSGRTANTYTAIALMRAKGGTPTNGSGVLVGFYGTGTNNTLYGPFWRHSTPGLPFGHTYDSSTGVNENNLCILRTTAERACKTSLTSISSGGAWQTWSAREALTERDALMRRNGDNTNFGQSKFYDPITLNAPYTLTLGANPQTLQPTAEMDVAEIIIYDRLLTCPQIESIEQYLTTKWSFGNYSSEGCNENTLPAY